MEEDRGGCRDGGSILKGLKKERRGEDYKHGRREEKGQSEHVFWCHSNVSLQLHVVLLF